MDLTTWAIVILSGGMVVVMGSLAVAACLNSGRISREEEAQDEGHDTDGVGTRGFGRGAVHGAVPGDSVRDSGAGLAAEVAALTSEVWRLRIDRSNLRLALQWECEETARLRGLLKLPATYAVKGVDPAVVLCLGELAGEQERQEAERRLAAEERAWVPTQGPDVASLPRVSGGAT